MIKLELVTLDGTKFGEEVHEAHLPTPDGIIGVYENHMPLVSLASEGIISVRRKAGDPDDFMEFFAVSGGVIEIEGNVIRVLVDEADSGDELDEAEVERAIAEAKRLRAEAKDQVSLEHAQSMIQRQTTRLKVAGLRRRKRR